MPLAHPRIRSDLLYQPDPGDEHNVYVKDPIRRQFHRFNILQVEMMRSLDGKRSGAEVAELLEDEFEVEVPAAQIQQFTARLGREFLLDIASYRVDDAKTRRAIARALRRRGLVYRSAPRPGAMAEEHRLFEEGVRHAQGGDPTQAASYFEAVLELNPDNARARDSLACIHEAFFRSKVNRPSHILMWRLWNADRFLAWMDARIGRLLFSVWGLAALVLFVLSAVPSIVYVLSQPTLIDGVGAFDVVIAVAVTLADMFVHEVFGHGLACKHFGGRVDDVGLMLLYGVAPGAYCDTSDTYLFARSRDKVTVYLAGVAGNLAFEVALWHLCALTAPSFALRDGILLMLLFTLWRNFANLLPLIPLDGYYALSDWLRIPNLRARSFAHVQALLQRHLLGVRSGDPPSSARERRVFLVFGALAAVYTVVYIYGIWISFLLPLATEHLGGLGIVIAAVYFANLLGRVMLRHLIRFARFVHRERAAIFTRRRSIAFAVTGLALVAALMAPWPVYVDGAMVAEPAQRARIRATEPGALAELRVREGDRVAAGQVLAVLQSPALARDAAVDREKLRAAQLSLARLERGARPEELALAATSARSTRVAERLADSQLQRVRQMVDSAVATRAELQGAEALAESTRGASAVSQIEERTVAAGARSEEIAQARADVARWQALVDDAGARLARLEVKSPIAGVVSGRHLAWRAGEWLEQGDELCQVLDVARLRVEVTPDHGEPLDGLAAGQTVALRAVGDAHQEIEAEVVRILPPAHGTSEPLRLVTSSAAGAGWRPGMSGHARVYGPSRTVAYRLIAVPLIRILDYELWRSLWG